jgi:hypothetical protein
MKLWFYLYFSFLFLSMNLLTIFFDFLSYHVKVSDRWEICVSLSDGQFQQVSTRSFEAQGVLSTLLLQLY